MLSRAELAEALVAHAGAGDLARARTELAEAVAQARAMGMTHRVETWVAQAIALQSPATPAVLSRSDEGWTVRCGGRRIDLPDLVGLRYLARLLAQPGRELTAVELADAAVVDNRHELLDGVAVAAYRQRIRDLAVAIEDADPIKAERLRAERSAIVGELAGAVGLGGRMRGFASSPERARTAVRKALTRAVDAITAADPVLGGELRAAVGTGAVCRYQPDGPARPWQVKQE
jgi:hypothetical protein